VNEARVNRLQVVTVQGPIPPDELGVTLSHDHLLVDAWGMTPGFENYATILYDEAIAIDEMKRFKAAGGHAVCDPTNIGVGRNPEGLQRISSASGVHVVMGSAWYRERVYPRYVFEEGPTALAERLVRELVDGVDDTGIRPGFIGEIGTERFSISPAQERVFRAAARAQKRTGCPIMTHTTHWGELALEQLDLLEEEGVDPKRVIISHLGDRQGVHWLLPIAKRGAWINIDNLAFHDYAPLKVRADNVAALWEAGHGEQMMLSNDICKIDQLGSHGGCGYDNIIRNFYPLLLERGLTEDHIKTMTVANPAKAFAYDADRARRVEGSRTVRMHQPADR
jgi:predicted metal-dependent phosphotriesterase family hydrolase